MINKNITMKTLTEFKATLTDNIRIDTFRIESLSDALISDVLPQYIETVEVLLNDTEIEKYKYNPKLLSYDVYKSTDLWFLICNINKCKRSFDFTPNSSVYLPTTSSVNRCIEALSIFGKWY